MCRKLVFLIPFAIMAVGCRNDSGTALADADPPETRNMTQSPHIVADVPPDVIKYYIEDGKIVPTLINGTVVDTSKWLEVVSLKIGTSGCTATLVGPKVLVTAAHCGATGAAATFTLGGKNYSGKIERSSLYPAKDHDISVVILDQAVAKADVGQFAAIGGKAEVGKEVFLMGYGCTQTGGADTPDGKLRIGSARIDSFSGYDMVSKGGAALCFGDSGGPGLMSDDSAKPQIISVNSKGNIRCNISDLRA